MAKMIKISYLAALMIFVLLLSGCEGKIGSKLKWLDKKIGEGFNELQKKEQKDLINFIEGQGKEKNAEEDTKLTSEQKKKIDEWLEKNNLNRYGDSQGVMYIGGTPLFNEATGERIDRFDYILNKYPNLLDELD